jgi:hypothetical protein
MAVFVSFTQDSGRVVHVNPEHVTTICEDPEDPSKTFVAMSNMQDSAYVIDMIVDKVIYLLTFPPRPAPRGKIPAPQLNPKLVS